jgi:type IV pilus assembly protein PilA
MRRIKNHGFSLVEILVAVAIVGVLVAIAIPNFDNYVAKTRQSEAKSSLSGIYSSEKMFFSEYAFYTFCLWHAGYQPEPSATRFYLTGFFNGVDDGCGVGTCWKPRNRGTEVCTVVPVPFGASVRNDATFNMNRWANPALQGAGVPKSYSAGRRTFNAVAFGSVSRRSRVLDVWEITQGGVVNHDQNGL